MEGEGDIAKHASIIASKVLEAWAHELTGNHTHAPGEAGVIPALSSAISSEEFDHAIDESFFIMNFEDIQYGNIDNKEAKDETAKNDEEDYQAQAWDNDSISDFSQHCRSNDSDDESDTEDSLHLYASNRPDTEADEETLEETRLRKFCEEMAGEKIPVSWPWSGGCRYSVHIQLLTSHQDGFSSTEPSAPA